MNAVAQIDFYPHTFASAILGISERELRDDRALLRRKLKREFKDKPYSKGLTPEDFRIVQKFRELAKQRGSEAAIEYIRVYGV